MGPLGTILSLPVSGTLSGLTWLAKQIHDAAMQELLDPARIERALLALERRLEAGEIDEATFEQEEERLLEELAEITAGRTEEAADPASEETTIEPNPHGNTSWPGPSRPPATSQAPLEDPPPAPDRDEADRPARQKAEAWT